jgi:hypothetical protein
MNFKQIFGLLLLIVMVATAYGLFGGVSTHEKSGLMQPVINSTNQSANVTEISEGTYDVQTQAQVDGGAIAVIIGLIFITSIGGIANADTKED